MLKVDGEFYYIDINAIDEFVFKPKEYDENEEDGEIIRDANGDVLQETKINKANKDRYTNIRYDIVKTMLDTLYNSGVESDDGNLKYLQNMEENSMGSKLVFNTLLVNKFIKDKLNQE